MENKWRWHVGLMIGAVIGATAYILFNMAGVSKSDAGALGSPTAAVSGGAVWGVIVVWARNKLNEPKK